MNRLSGRLTRHGSATVPAWADTVYMACLVKGEERYVFLYDDANRYETLCILNWFAANQELSFTWHDAMQLSLKIRQETKT